MIVTIRNKIFSLSGKSEVTNAQTGEPVAKVKGRIFSISRKKFIQDLNGNTFFKVRNKMFHLFTNSALIYDKDKKLVCQIKRKISLNADYKFLKGAEDFKILGNIFAWDFKIYKGNILWGTVSRNFDFTDCFNLDVADENLYFGIALVIALDNIMDKSRNQMN